MVDQVEIREMFDTAYSLSASNVHYPSGPLLQRRHRYKVHIGDENETRAIYGPTECHSHSLRMKSALCYKKLLNKRTQKVDHATLLVDAIKNLDIKCSTYPEEKHVAEMLQHLKEMPKEWTLVQLTPKYNPLENFQEDINTYYTEAIHISIFHCGPAAPDPFLVTAGPPKDPVNGQTVKLANEMYSIIRDNKEVLTYGSKRRNFRSLAEKSDYLSKRRSIEDRLKFLVKDMQYLWLKQWRCLFTGKYCDEALEEQIIHGISNGIANVKVTEKAKAILTCLVKNFVTLKSTEVRAAIQYCFPEVTDKSVIKTIALAVKKLNEDIVGSSDELKRNPIILILHEDLDAFPWEMMDVLKEKPVTRVPSLRFLYNLYKSHRNDIVDGYKIIKYSNKGCYVVNPDKDLDNMETRIMSFFNYWMPSWSGISGSQPEDGKFLEYLTSADVFLYSGHGNGSHLMALEQVQKSNIKAVVLLFGCGSVRNNRLDPQVEMFASYHYYLMGKCPSVVGMLWEVTDLDTDVLTTNFLSYWIPSKAPIHWKYVDKTDWNKALSDKMNFQKVTKGAGQEKYWEPELLRALNEAKHGLKYYSTKAACVVRGIPVKIQLVS
ncbi:unnamed protein product [Acanthoscelides obtectus]|uniref:separase n=1 Tax=Acanthoscelides obtectus TaxID=200917 RepID=A0A9P0Q691_ACAOB|nr:unnamed protein product [Acanthoscelides obtectus]CAK1677703.1 Separin [Acanthoscelides obtectus]